MTVTISMPYWKNPEHVGRAVESVLSQTYRDLRLVVVNDGDTGTPPWPHLEHIDDPRLVRFDLPVNRGRYYADAVTLAACDTEWWAPHDTDDWSPPARISRLVAKSDGVDVVLGSIRKSRANGTSYTQQPKRGMAAKELVRRPRRPTNHVTCLFRTGPLRSIGGPHPEFRLTYDVMMVWLAYVSLRCAFAPEAVYMREYRATSLTVHPETAIGSPERKRQQERRNQLYAKVMAADRDDWPKILAPSRQVAEALKQDAGRLAEMIGR